MRPNWTVYTRMLLVAAIACLASVARADDKKDGDKKEGEKKAGNVTGTWKWTMAGQNGQQRESTLKLKQDGEKLTGALMGRNNQETEIADGKVKDGQVSFKVTRKFNDQEVTTSYSGKLEGDTIKGKIERGGGGTPRDWEAKRVKEEEKKEDKKEEKKE